jgi:hypothetical protein
MSNLLGKRYRCKVCGTEALCTNAGDGEVVCHDEKMEEVAPRPIPSSD